MPEAIQYDESDAVSLGDEPCGGVHEEIFASDDDRTLRVLRRSFKGELRLPRTRGCQRILLSLEGEGARIDHAGDGPQAGLRALAPYRSNAGWRTEISGDVTLLELLTDDDLLSVEVSALRLGSRTMRDSLAAGAAFVHAHAGALLLRITDEEDPFELAAGESLWLDELEGDEELEVTGRDEELVAVLVHLQRRG